MRRTRARSDSFFPPVSSAVVVTGVTILAVFSLSAQLNNDAVAAFSPITPMAATTQAQQRLQEQSMKPLSFPIPMAMVDDPQTTIDAGKVNSEDNTSNQLSLLDDNKDEDKKSKLLGPHKKIGMQLAAAAMAFSLAFLPAQDADAAMSGGRMGGSFQSSPRQSMSRPAPSRSSYGGGGYSRGYSSRSTTIITPGGYGYGYGYSPFMSPFSPFTPRIYGSPGVISYSRGPSFFDLLLVGGFMFAVAQPFINSLKESSSTSGGLDWGSNGSMSSALGPGTSVCQVSVALEVPNRDDPNSILSALDRLAQTARTDSRVGLQNLSSQVALELLRRRSSIVSANSSYKHFNDRSKALRDFQSRSVKERSKFETETVSQFGGVNYGIGSNDKVSGSNGGKATMAVVTLLLAIDGDSTKGPKINSVEDLEKTLRKISADAKVDDCLQSAEILWTPTERWESLSPRDVVADYPELRSI
mmetsp:Transcript_16925/g.40997  ORF Transcript_16925/g.40997 Transcript_16925/m.40997 type:complete len:470 (+) Transcript_16925:2094-3503(+)